MPKRSFTETWNQACLDTYMGIVLNTFFGGVKGDLVEMGGQGLALTDTFDNKKIIQKLLVMIKGTHSFKPSNNSGIIFRIEKL